MINESNLAGLIGADLVDGSGSKVGTIGQIFLDDQSGKPEWATVTTGMFGSKQSFVPLHGADESGSGLRVQFSKDQIKNAPRVDAEGGHLDESEEAELYHHYGLTYSDSDTMVGGDTTVGRDTSKAGRRDTVGRDTSGPTTDDAMTRSEERLRTGTERVTTGKARLRKWIETENVSITVPIRREKARLETEPITDANRDAAMRGGDLTSEEHEVILTEERPIITKETVPVERVRLTKDVEQSQETVSESVRKEVIAAEGDVIDVAGTKDLAGNKSADSDRR